MRDKLTKKRVRVDYMLVIKCAGLMDEFTRWLNHKKSRVSMNRLGYAFCMHYKVDVDTIYSRCLEKGIKTYDEYFAELVRIARTPWLDD